MQYKQVYLKFPIANDCIATKLVTKLVISGVSWNDIVA